MVRIGFITEHPTKPKKLFWGEYTKDVFLNEKNPFELISVIIPYSQNSLKRMNPKRLKRVIDKAIGVLENDGTKHVLYSPFIKQISYDDNASGYAEVKKSLFEKWAYACVMNVAEKYNMKLLDAKVCISDSKLDRISETLMAMLCYDTQNLVLRTDNQNKAQQVRDRFFEETGMNIKITNHININAVDVLIDVDNASVRFGRNLLIDGVSGDFELAGLPIDPVEITAYLGDFGINNRNLYYFSGKKKLTL